MARRTFLLLPSPVLTCPDSEFVSRKPRATRQEDQPVIGLVFFLLTGAGSWGSPGTSVIRTATAIWLFSLSPGHSSVRPPTRRRPEVHERLQRNHRQLAAFGGSGTPVIAAEKSGRYARVMELGPTYVDTIVRRWQDYAGPKANRESDGVTFDDLASKAVGVCGE